MAEYNVKIWQTVKLYNNVGTTPLDRAKTYIQGAFNQNSSFSVNITLSTSRPNPPTEDPSASFTASGPCDSFEYSYGNLPEWFDDWMINCGHNRVKDVNMLLTNYDNNVGEINDRGSSGSKDSCACGGAFRLPNLPDTYTKYGAKMGTTII